MLCGGHEAERAVEKKLTCRSSGRSSMRGMSAMLQRAGPSMLLKQILSPSPRKTRVVRPMLGDEVRVRVSGRVVDGEDLESRELGFRLGQKECFRGLEEAELCGC
ncbi:unnamed protein product [Effrenium voratum]|nr:unnamed protein product [Effrenium voratum]